MNRGRWAKGRVRKPARLSCVPPHLGLGLPGKGRAIAVQVFSSDLRVPSDVPSAVGGLAALDGVAAVCFLASLYRPLAALSSLGVACALIATALGRYAFVMDRPLLTMHERKYPA